MIELMDQTQPKNSQENALEQNPHSAADHISDQQSTLKTFIRRFEDFFSLAIFIAAIVLATFLIKWFVFESYFVDGTSMTPTLQNNDRLIIDKVGKTLALIESKPYIPQRGQIIVLDSSILDVNGNNEQLIKRVIGLPGETVIIKDGVVTVKNSEHPNGFNVDENQGLKLAPTYSPAPLELTVPSGRVFILGDNRAKGGSLDSRYLGPIDTKEIQGKLAVRLYPFNKVSSFK